MIDVEIPRRHFRCIVADPPWRFRTRSPKVRNPASSRHSDRHYPSMSIEEIATIPVWEFAHPQGCHLFLWTTAAHLVGALGVMQSWGFRYSTVCFTWAKLRRSFDPLQLRVLPTLDGDFHVGLGLTTRRNCEFVLLGRRGSPKRTSNKVRELIVSPVREHSRKPDEFYRRVEEYAVGPRLELFARQRREGWTTWGNQVDKFSPLPTQAAAE